MQPLIDADVLVYEVGYAAETAWKGENPGSLDPPPFDLCATLLDNRINNTCAVVGATQPPILYLTGKTNFRFGIAKRTPYKDRPGKKPYHYKNILAYIKGKYDYRITEGLEADDLMSIEQTRVERLLWGAVVPGLPDGGDGSTRTIICTRDKDLRSVPGMHFGWELGMQPQFGPEEVSRIGYIALSKDRKKVKGTGLLFFYSQCLTGDTVDSIPGLPKCGPVAAYAILEGSETETDCFERVLAAYQAVFGDRAEEELLEQGRLLHMTRELDEEGSPILWRFPQ